MAARGDGFRAVASIDAKPCSLARRRRLTSVARIPSILARALGITRGRHLAALRPQWALTVLVLLGCALPALPAHAQNNTGYATTAGTGGYRDNLLWLDMTGFANNNLAQNFSFRLPDRSVLAFTITKTGAAADDVASPTWPAAAIGNAGGAYIGIPGRPFIYATGSTANFFLQLTNIRVTDAAGNQRPFTLFAGDAESVGNSENMQFETNGTAWRLRELIRALSGNAPSETLTGIGTTTVVWTGTSANVDFGSLIISSDYPAQATGNSLLIANSAPLSRGGILFGVMMAKTTLVKALNPSGRGAASDQFAMSGRYTAPFAPIAITATTGAGTTVGNGTVAVPSLTGQTITLAEAMAAGSVSGLSAYTSAIACTNARAGSATALPSGPGTSFTLTPAVDDVIACTLTNTPQPADLLITKSNTYTPAQPGDLPSDTVTSGTSTLYTLVVTNNGPGTVTGAIAKDTPISGLTCPPANAVTITGNGVPPGSFTMSNLSAGIALGALAAGQSATLTFTCTVN